MPHLFLLRASLLLAALVTLSACNVVVTQTPLYTLADEAGAPPMKPGVWSFEPNDCAFDEAKPMVQWPDCAGGAVVSPGMITGHDTRDGKDVWDHLPLVLAAGQPRVAQVLFQPENLHPAPGAKLQDSAPYGYAGVRPTKSDAEGRIIAITYWIAMCGPPAPPSNKPGELNLGTRRPLPGMVMKKGDPVCLATSRAALVGSVKASEAWEDKPMHAHWVRSAGRGDGPA